MMEIDVRNFNIMNHDTGSNLAVQCYRDISKPPAACTFLWSPPTILNSLDKSCGCLKLQGEGTWPGLSSPGWLSQRILQLK
jgi:hypothetical protein